MTLRELLERRDAAVSEMRGLANKAEGESRDLTEDEERRFNALKSDIGDFDKRIGRAQTLAEAERAAPAVTVAGRGSDTFEARAHEFSITSVIAAQLGESVDIGRERELSAEVRRRNPGRKFAGIPVPEQVFLERRVMLTGDATTPGAAWPLYPHQHRPDLFIDRLRSALVVERLGATVLNDLQGDQDIPRQTGSATVHWVAEDQPVDESDLAFDDVTLSPKTVGAITSYSRRTMINASPDIEQIVRNDLAAVIARAIDAAAMLGPGTGNMPLGIVHTPGVTEIALGATTTWAQILSFPAIIQGEDADVGSLAWAMSPWAAAALQAIPQDTDVGAAGFMMPGPTTLGGYPVAVSTLLPGNPSGTPVPGTVIFGAWSQLLVGYWSGVDLLLNPYSDTAFPRGRVLVRAMRDVDVAVRHPESFVFADDLVMPAPPASTVQGRLSGAPPRITAGSGTSTPTSGQSDRTPSRSDSAPSSSRRS